MRNTAQARVEARIAAYASQPAPEAAPANGLVHYEQAKAALAEAVRIDDAKTIRDKAEAIGVYAAQSKDTTLHVYATKIKLRAERRIGELSKQLETAERTRTDLHPERGKQTKAATLKDAGISTSQAHRYEKLAALDDHLFEQAMDIATTEKPTASTTVLLRIAERLQRPAESNATVHELMSADERVAWDEGMKEGGKMIADFAERQAADARWGAEVGERFPLSPEIEQAKAAAQDILVKLKALDDTLAAAPIPPQFEHRWGEAYDHARSIVKQLEKLSCK